MNKNILDKSHNPKERAEHLVSQMTLEEKASQLSYESPAIERLGIPQYNWWNEALHGVARAGTATVFPQAIGLAAMFDDAFLEEIGDIVATEARAKHHEFVRQGDRDIYKGLTMWSPNVNIFRDPRWGRGQETYGEDPYLTAKLWVAYIKGLQGSDPDCLKTAACAKHYAVHSGPESLRHEFDAVVSQKDLWETYLPAFEACVKQGQVESVMGAYNQVNGELSCASPTLLQKILRNKWGFEGHVVSDCGAIDDFHMFHKVTKTPVESAALALKNGCDLNCGHTYLQLLLAHKEGRVTEEEITLSAKRLFTTRFKLGMFDEGHPYQNIAYEVNDCKAHQDKNLEAATKSMVLLKNDGLLPLHKEKINSIAVIGPNADRQIALYGNYCGTAAQMITPLEGIREAVGEETKIYYSPGCHLYKSRVEAMTRENDRLTEALSMVQRADVTVMVMGLDSPIEGEQGDANNAYSSGDRNDLGLPPAQQILMDAVYKLNKPLILVLMSGSAIAAKGADENCSAIIQAWYPGAMGGRGLANILFGKASPSGKLPVTIYQSAEDLPPFEDYAMKGRTYRYMEKEALYPFGFGLGYGKIKLANLTGPEKGLEGEQVTLEVLAENPGQEPVEEVLQCYVKVLNSSLAPTNPSLCAFKRVRLKPGEGKKVAFSVAFEALQVVNEKGKRVVDGKEFEFYVGVSQPDGRSLQLTGQKPLLCRYKLV